MTDDTPSMIDESDGELLSAFVDGELTEDQRVHVEARLRTDPVARRWVEELRDLSSTLRALPREAVGQDLSGKVLERGKKTLARRPLAPRRWTWAALAVAAALLLAITLPQTAPQQEHLLTKSRGLAGGENAQADVAELAPALRVGSDSGGAQIGLADSSGADVDDADDWVASKAAGNDDLYVEGEREIERLGRGGGLRGPSKRERLELAQADYDVQITFTRPDKFINLLAEQRVSYRRLQSSQTAQTKESRTSERLLVEATDEQIERVLAACHADTFYCRSLRVTGSAPGVEQPVAWKRWQRQESLAKEKKRPDRKSRPESDKSVAKESQTDLERAIILPESGLSEVGKQQLVQGGGGRKTEQPSSSELRARAEVGQRVAPFAERPLRVLFLLRLAPIGQP
ncbi:MAG: hypothetical protein MK171_01120 [Pirellulales bacterium]|nr:hypothetical protein [Pirellulales bacterium]